MADVNHGKREREQAVAAAAQLPESAVLQAVRVAYARLDESDQVIISNQVRSLMAQMRGYQFGESMALELLAKLGWKLEAWGPLPPRPGPDDER